MYDDDEQRNKEAHRTQLIFFMTLAMMFFIWLQYFAPKPTPPKVETQPEAEVQQSPAAKAVALEAATVAENRSAVNTWPNLPALPAESDLASVQDIVLHKGDMELVFTPIGGRLKKASLVSGEHAETRIQLVPEATVPDTEAVYPFGLRFSDDALKDELDRRKFEIEKATDAEVIFSITLPGAAVIKKTFAFTDSPHVVSATVTYTNLESGPRTLGRDLDPCYIFNWGPNITSGDLFKGVHQAVVWRAGNETSLLGTASMKPDKNGQPFTKRIPNAEWVGVRSAYFIVAMKPVNATSDGVALGDEKEFRFGLTVPKTEIAPGQTLSNTFDVYIGPSQHEQLQRAWPTLASSLQFFEYPEILDWFAKFLLRMLNWFYSVIPNYGVAIILLTVVVRTLMFPLTLKQMKTMKRMQMLAPEMEKLKKECGDDQQALQQRTMELYREYGMNPAAGCLPMFIQMPIFIALYRMLFSAYELRGAPFVFWIKDLSEPDRLMHIPALASLPWIFSHLQDINLLPVLSALAMLASVKLTPMTGPVQNPQQKMMMTVMPVFFSLFCYSLASGLNLYIFTSTVLGIAQSYVVRRQEVEKPEKVKPKKKKQHFYTAAIEKKKQAEREMKEKKRKERSRETAKKDGE